LVCAHHSPEDRRVVEDAGEDRALIDDRIVAAAGEDPNGNGA